MLLHELRELWLFDNLILIHWVKAKMRDCHAKKLFLHTNIFRDLSFSWQQWCLDFSNFLDIFPKLSTAFYMSNIYPDMTSHQTKIPKRVSEPFHTPIAVLTRLLGLVEWSFCGLPLSWCDHETIPVSCGSLKDRHLSCIHIFIISLHQCIY